jgi:anti-sigma regulatory factor (Ser/Thr protein kinase)
MGEKLILQYHVEGGDLTQAGEASSKMKMSLRRLGLPPEAIRRASICMYEGEINMVIHANGGDVTVEIGLEEIDITLADTGPGIPDVAQAMEEGYSTAGEVARDLGFGAGMGLPNMKRYSDEMTVESTVGVGTTVRMKIRLSTTEEKA